MRFPEVPLEFFAFGCTLLGVVFLHQRALAVALSGLVVVSLLKVLTSPFPMYSAMWDVAHQFAGEAVMLANLLGLLTGFALLSRHFEKSRAPLLLPRILPHGWWGGLALLMMVFVVSGVLDNIAAALIGGGAAHQLFRGKVHLGYLAGIVTAAKAGGAGSVIGDTTTTMMWLSGIPATRVMLAYLPAFIATAVVGVAAARVQERYSALIHGPRVHVAIDWIRLAIVIAMLLIAVATNIGISMWSPEWAERLPCVGISVWLVLIFSARLRRPDWEVIPGALRGAFFLLALVMSASMMPVNRLPEPGWASTLLLGFVSSVFDNIPLTALAIKQGGYDWAYLAYAVGVGGSMIWFGSSAGVAMANAFPEARSTGKWLRHAWYVPCGYLAGFAVLHALLGWRA